LQKENGDDADYDQKGMTADDGHMVLHAFKFNPPLLQLNTITLLSPPSFTITPQHSFL